ncbi:MAG: putative transporter [Muribaculaceae bacterium]|jgi:putative transport protein|nr:putative transporter [Muribaculaceae bacterium]
MNWIENLILNNGDQVANSLQANIGHAIFLFAFVIAIGVALGRIKIFGVSLGVTFVLFVGIVVGHFGLSTSHDVLSFTREFGLILFIFSIGMQVGPGFFSSFKKGGLMLNGLSTLIIVLNIVVALLIYYFCGNVRITDLVGILSGAVTNTPGLGAAQQTLNEVGGVNPATINEIHGMSMGYAAAYPLGVVGIILAMVIIKAIFRVKPDEETKNLEKDNEDSQLKPYVVTYRVSNKFMFNINIKKLHEIIDCNFVISRVKKTNGDFIIPKNDTILEENDLLLIVMSVQDEEKFAFFIGPKEEMDWDTTSGPVVSRRILVTNNEYSGRKIGSLRLRMGYKLNATRVNRAGVDLLAKPNLDLQIGDRITVVGNEDDINRLAEKLGNSLKRLNQPNMFTMFIGIFLGIIVGSIPLSFPGMSVPMKLGLAGGPLVVAILLSRYGYKVRLVTYTTSAANLLMREIGICLFLASVGIAAGGDFAKTVFNSTGALWVLYGFLITIIPLLVVGFIARAKCKLNYYSILGLISGSTTDPPALAYANKTANNDAPAVAYSTVYPLTMFLRVITAQILILALA